MSRYNLIAFGILIILAALVLLLIRAFYNADLLAFLTSLGIFADSVEGLKNMLVTILVIALIMTVIIVSLFIKLIISQFNRPQ